MEVVVPLEGKTGLNSKYIISSRPSITAGDVYDTGERKESKVIKLFGI